MDVLAYHDNELYIENVSLTHIAKQFGTPCFVYSKKKIFENWFEFSKALHSVSHALCYAVKSNSNITLLNLLAQLGAGFDIVSIGEAHRVITAGGKPEKIVFSGIGKTCEEMQAAIELKINCFNIESYSELIRLHEIARNKNIILNVALRVNPNIDPETHAHISTGLNENKFGVPIDDIVALAKEIKMLPFINLIGISSHIGSQIKALTPFTLLIEKLLQLVELLQKEDMTISHVNIGGGLGISDDQHNNVPTIKDYVDAILQKLDMPITIIFEPGRAIIGNAGVLLTRVEYLKHTAHKNFAIVDAGMNDLIRPALYGAYHQILPIKKNGQAAKYYDVVGPVCESTDFLGRDRLLAISENDLLAIANAGAYGMSMSSNYNSRPRAAEVLVEDDEFKLIRKRETIKEMMQHEIEALC